MADVTMPLKSCPFCGSSRVEGTYGSTPGFYDLFFIVECKSCKTQGPRAAKPEDALKEWNKRTNPYGRDPSGRWG